MTLANQIKELVAKSLDYSSEELTEQIGSKVSTFIKLVKVLDHLEGLDETLRTSEKADVLYEICGPEDKSLFNYIKEDCTFALSIVDEALETYKKSCLVANLECSCCKKKDVDWSWETMSERQCRFICPFCGLQGPLAGTPEEALVKWKKIKWED